MPDYKTELYALGTGNPITSLVSFSSPIEEYCTAFAERSSPFLNYYTFQDRDVQKQVLTRGEFWDLANSVAAYIIDQGLSKGDRIVHSFSANTVYDLVFRLAAVLTGCVPVTINWQADDNERIIYKATITKAKLMIYDSGFASRVEEVKPSLSQMQFAEASKVAQNQVRNQLTYPSLSYDDEKIIVFTSGTTGKPNGVSLSHRSYLANRLTFEQYFGVSDTTRLDLLLVNPLHHGNSTAIWDWGLRRSGATIHLVERYSTLY